MLDFLKKPLARFENREFMEAIVAGCTLVAAIDGHIDDSEKAKMMKLFNKIDELNVFEIQEIISVFNEVKQMLEFDISVGKEGAMKLIRKIKSNRNNSRTAIHIYCAIGQADGCFDDNEKSIIREICHELDFKPDEFEL